MKLVAPALFVTTWLVPTLALACPSSAGSHCSGGAGLAAPFGIGLVAGILSIVFERTFAKKSDKR
jgi:hypothetical protein